MQSSNLGRQIALVGDPCASAWFGAYSCGPAFLFPFEHAAEGMSRCDLVFASAVCGRLDVALWSKMVEVADR